MKKNSQNLKSKIEISISLFFKFSVFLLFFTLHFLFSVISASAATLNFSPSAGSYEVHKIFSVNVYVSSADQAMNAASGAVSFPADKLEVVSLSKSGSIFNLWALEPSFSNSAGTINFEGIAMNPGFTGSSGKILTLTFKVKAAGEASLIFSSGMVLANDGAGTNILAGLGGAKFNIAAPVKEEPSPAAADSEKKQPASSPAAPAQPALEEATAPAKINNTPAAPLVISPTHPDQNKWYANNNPGFEFVLPKGVSGVNVLADRNSNTDPGTRSDGLFSSYAYKDVDDGVWYFHVRLRNGYGWGEIAHFRFQIDTAPPEPFTIKFIDGNERENHRPTITVDHKDALSGIAGHCDVKIDNGEWFASNYEDGIERPDQPHIFRLPPQRIGQHTIVVKVSDKAGNSASASDEFTVKPITAPEITDYPRELAAGETLNAAGKTIYFNADVIIWLQKDKTEPQKYSSLSDGEGKFIFNKKELGEGVYRLWAAAVDKEGGQSSLSAKAVITVKQSVFSSFSARLISAGDWVVKFLTVLIPVVALLLLLMLLPWYGWQKFSKLKLKAAKEIRLAKKAFQKELEKSRKDVQKRIEILEGNRARQRFVDEAEERIIERLKKDLDYIKEFSKEDKIK